MQSTRRFAIVFVTAPDSKVARMLVQRALKERLIACANLIPGIESHYLWRGKLERGSEVLMVLKTARRHLPALEKLILAHHPYDTPEFVVVPLAGGTERYLAWLGDSVSAQAR